jgi:protein PsiE
LNPTKQERQVSIKRIIDLTEKSFLVIIALFTVGAMVQEVMVGAFYSSHRIPITIPLIIAMTALSRLIILQGKDGDPTILLYESGSILLIAIACWVISNLHERD